MTIVVSDKKKIIFSRKKPEISKTTHTPMPQLKCYLEHRKSSERLKQLKKVQIIFDNGSYTIDAILRDISEGGARVEVVHPEEIPEKFMPKFTSEYKTKLCQIIWHDSKYIGLRLIS